MRRHPQLGTVPSPLTVSSREEGNRSGGYSRDASASTSTSGSDAVSFGSARGGLLARDRGGFAPARPRQVHSELDDILRSSVDLSDSPPAGRRRTVTDSKEPRRKRFASRPHRQQTISIDEESRLLARARPPAKPPRQRHSMVPALGMLNSRQPSLDDPANFRHMIERLRRLTRDMSFEPDDADGSRLGEEDEDAAAKPVCRYSRDELRVIFRRAIRSMVILVTAARKIRKETTKNTVLSALQLQYETARRQTEGSLFRDDGNRQGPFAIPWPAKAAMLKPYEERSEADLAALHAHLSSLLDYKEKFSKNVQKILCQTGHYVKYERMRTILREGHPGDSFFIILRGSVLVNVRDIDQRTHATFLRTEAILSEGQSFGDMALVRRNRRTATIIAHEDVELMMVYRDSFQKISPEIFQEEFSQKTIRAATLTVMSGWSLEAVENVCVEATIKEYGDSEVISFDTVDDLFVYVVMDGQVVVACCVNVRELARSVPPSRFDAALQKLPKSTLARPWSQPQPEKLGDRATREAWAEVEPFWRRSAQKLSKKELAFIRIGAMWTDDCCDLASLVDKTAKPMILLAGGRGAKVLRLPKTSLRAHAPQPFWIALKGTAGLSMRPDDKVLFSAYLKDHSWKVYSKCVYSEVLSRQAGASLANIPATAKGTTGAAKWPGVRFFKPYRRLDSQFDRGFQADDWERGGEEESGRHGNGTRSDGALGKSAQPAGMRSKSVMKMEGLQARGAKVNHLRSKSTKTVVSAQIPWRRRRTE